jgi:hypothetical protein
MFTCPGETDAIGAATPLIVTETPARVMGQGGPLILTVEAASCAPEMVINSPGAKTLAGDAALATLVIDVLEEPPTTSATGTLTACGAADGERIISVVRYTPLGKLVEFAWRTAWALPELAFGEILNH